jgi:serine/threonine-protein kinase
MKIPPPVVANIIIEALEGLHYAHNLKDFDGTPLGVIHRDISPQNVFITYEGSVKLLDFGIAKAATHVVETRTGIIKGKFAYIAPEQARGGKIDHRADIWSMGVVLWETLARRRLFKGPNDVATLSETLTGKIPSLRELDPELPEALDSVAKKALSRDISARYQTALEMRDDLRGFIVAEAPKTSHEEVSSFIKKLFNDVIDQNRRVLKLCLSDATAEHGISTGEYRMLTQTPGGELAASPSSGSGSITPASQPSGVVRLPAASHPSLTPVSGTELTPSQQAAVAEQQKQAARFTTVVWLAVLLLVIPIAAVTGWLITRGGDDEAQAANDVRPTPPPPEKVPSAPQAHVVLTSTPTNAEVRLGGTVLGRTPLERDLDQLPLGVNVSFVFSLDGHDDLAVSSPLRGERVDVHADFTKVAPRAQPDAGPQVATETKAPPSDKVRRPPNWWLRDHTRRPPDENQSSSTTTAQQGEGQQDTGEGDTKTKIPTIDSPRPRVILDEGKAPGVPIID